MSKSMTSIRVARGMFQSLCIVSLLMTCGELSAQNEVPRVRNIVLVHGAWADGSRWKGVSDIPVKDGFKVSIVHTLSTGYSSVRTLGERYVQRLVPARDRG